DPRPRAVALEPHAAAHVEAEVVAAHPQRIGADAPALAFAPAVDGAGEAGLVGNAEAAWPFEAEARARIELQGQCVAVAEQPARQAMEAGRVADRRVARLAHGRRCAQRTAGREA